MGMCEINYDDYSVEEQEKIEKYKSKGYSDQLIERSIAKEREYEKKKKEKEAVKEAVKDAVKDAVIKDAVIKEKDLHWYYIGSADLNLDFGGDNKETAETNYMQLPNGVVLSRTVSAYSGCPAKILKSVSPAKILKSVSTTMVFIPNLQIENQIEENKEGKKNENKG